MGVPTRQDKPASCPLCGASVPAGSEAMNRHFEEECTSRTGQAPDER
jgi:hypothetical protein